MQEHGSRWPLRCRSSQYKKKLNPVLLYPTMIKMANRCWELLIYTSRVRRMVSFHHKTHQYCCGSLSHLPLWIFSLFNHLIWTSASYGSLARAFWEMRQSLALQRQLQLCYSCIFIPTTSGSLCIYLICLISIFLHHHGGMFCVKEKLCSSPHRQSSLVLCFIPQVGKNGVVNEGRKCRDQKPGFAFLSCYDFSCFCAHIFICLSHVYG